MSQVTRVLGCSPLTASYVYSNISFSPYSVFEQSLRWKRKPIWLPTAKSKVFKVPLRPVIPDEEALEIKRLFNQYRTAVKSVRKYMMQLAEEKKVQLDPLIIEKAKEEDFLSCSAINDEWNKKIAVEREARLEKERLEKKEKILYSIEKNKKIEEAIMKKAAEDIKKAQELVPNLITRSNIDEAIEEALRTVVDHNYAIDINGNRYTGDNIELSGNQSSDQKKVQVFQ